MPKLVFLDVDGVFNRHVYCPVAGSSSLDRELVLILNGVLAETGANVVLSSAWRYHVHTGRMTLAGLEWLFRSHGLMSGRLVGVTREDTLTDEVWEWPGDANGRMSGRGHKPVENERGRQIRDWLTEHRPAGVPYVVVDDLDLGITAAGHPFVQTDGKVGLTAEHAARMVAILNGGGG